MKIGYKLCHNLLPTKVADLIRRDHTGQSITKEHSYQTRNKYIPNLPSVSNNKYKASFLCCAIREYSALNNELKSCRTQKHLYVSVKEYWYQIKMGTDPEGLN